jgi:hypothetical protein
MTNIKVNLIHFFQAKVPCIRSNHCEDLYISNPIFSGFPEFFQKFSKVLKEGLVLERLSDLEGIILLMG